MILYVQSPKNSTQKKTLLELISKFVKVEGHKIKTQKSVVCLYTNNEQRKEEVKKQFCL